LRPLLFVDLNTDLAEIKEDLADGGIILCQKLKICGDVDKARNNKIAVTLSFMMIKRIRCSSILVDVGSIGQRKSKF
jgi:hypothetical protein